MSPKLLLRSAAILLFIHFLGHTVGHLTWDDSEGALFDIVKTMKSESADFMGATRSLADYYNGYSLLMFGIFAYSIVQLWYISNQLQNYTQPFAPIMLFTGVMYLFFGIVESLCFFPFAAIVSGLAGVLCIIAYQLSKNKKLNI